MSIKYWEGEILYQGVHDHKEILGYVEYENQTGKYIMWLRDNTLAFGDSKSYVRGDEYNTLLDAKEKGIMSGAANLMHMMWMVDLQRKGLLPDS